MRQHAIPQNILDVEFKLFTKFTLKEFAYLAIGIGFGGVMIYLTVNNTIPGILGFPIFVLSSGAGIFLGLVPINDQDADVFIKNYVTAITNPTQRVWLSKEMRKKRVKPEIKPTEDGNLIPKDVKKEKKKIIGGNIFPNKQTPEETVENSQEEEKLAPLQMDPSLLLINKDNLKNYQFKIDSVDRLPGNINIWICTKDFKPVPNAVVYLKNNSGKIVFANRTGPNGYFLTSRIWEKGMYTVEFEHPVYKFPKLQIDLEENSSKLPIKISNI